MGEERFLIKDQGFLSTLSTALSDLYDDDQYKDFQCRAFSCSRLVLHAALPDINEDQYEAKFAGIHIALRDELLRYLYCWQISISWSDMPDLIKACRTLRLLSLLSQCKDFVIDESPPKDYISWFIFGRDNGFLNLSQRFQDRMIFDLESLMYTDEFLELSIGEMEDFLKLSANKGSPDIKFKATLKWLCVSPDRIHIHSERLLSLIGVQKCSQQALALSKETQFAQVLHQSSQTVNEICELIKKYDETYCDEAADEAAQQKEEHAISRSTDNTPDVFFINCDITFAKHMMARYFSLRETFEKDICITLQNGSVMAQKLILAAACPYFAGLVRTGSLLNDSDSDMFTSSLEILDDASVRALVQYMYSGAMSVNSDAVMECMTACDYLQMSDALQECCQYVESLEITPSVCLKFLKASFLFDLPKTRSRCTECLARNIKSLCRQEEIGEFILTELLQVLDHKSMMVLPAGYLYTLCLSWVQAEFADHGEHVHEVLHSNAVLTSRYDGGDDLEHFLAHIQPCSTETVMLITCLRALIKVISIFILFFHVEDKS